MKNSLLIVVLSIIALLSSNRLALTQDYTGSHKSLWAIDLWTGGGVGMNGPDKGSNVLLSGVRFSRTIWTGQNGGSLQYGIDVIPLFLMDQESKAFGFSATPVLLRWNLNSARPISPFIEFGAGVLFTNKEVPEKTSDVNFTPQAAAGVHIFTGKDAATTISFRFMHISNAGMESPNPGVNTLQLSAGYTWFF